MGKKRVPLPLFWPEANSSMAVGIIWILFRNRIVLAILYIPSTHTYSIGYSNSSGFTNTNLTKNFTVCSQFLYLDHAISIGLGERGNASTANILPTRQRLISDKLEKDRSRQPEGPTCDLRSFCTKSERSKNMLLWSFRVLSFIISLLNHTIKDYYCCGLP